MARSRFSYKEEVVRERVDIRVQDQDHGADETQQKHLIWWYATYIFLALLALIMFLAWSLRSHFGYAWKDENLIVGSVNYHGVFMITAFLLLNGIGKYWEMTFVIFVKALKIFIPADVLYRTYRHSNRLAVKITHATLQTTGFALIVTGLCAIWWWHGAKNRPNLQSAHSWIGLLIVLLYGLQVSARKSFRSAPSELKVTTPGSFVAHKRKEIGEQQI